MLGYDRVRNYDGSMGEWANRDATPLTLLQADENWGVQSRSVGIAGSLRVSLRYNFFPLPGQEGGQGDGRKGSSKPC